MLEDDQTTAALQGAGEASLDGRPGPTVGSPPTKNHMSSPLQKQVSPHPGPWEHDNGTRRLWTRVQDPHGGHRGRLQAFSSQTPQRQVFPRRSLPFLKGLPSGPAA